MSLRAFAHAFFLIVGSWSVLFAGTASAQQPLATVHGGAAFDHFGRAVSGAFDVDMDGNDDVIVGAWNDSDIAPFAGAAHVYSGSGGLLLSMHGENAYDQFGAAVAGVGDIDQDGFADLAIGAPFRDINGTDSGSVRIFSGFGGGAVWTFVGDGFGDQLGTAVSAAGDVNNDGFVDVLVGAVGDDDNGSNCGMARVHSGFDASALRTWYGVGMDDAFGAAVAAGGDIDSDGFDDVIIGSPLSDQGGADTGAVEVRSGVDGGLMHQRIGVFSGDFLGASVSGGLNFDGDGFLDFVIGVPGADQGATNAGAVLAVHGSDGGIRFTIDGSAPYDRLGFAVSNLGDFDADSYDDLIVGVRFANHPAFDSGAVEIRSGATGSLLGVFGGDSALDEFGYAVAGAGDVNGDDVPDFIAGAWLDDDAGTDAGSARIFTGACGQLSSYGIGCAGSNGVIPTLAVDGCPAGDAVLNLHVENGLGGSIGLFWVGVNQSSLTIVGDCKLLVGPNVVVTLGPFPLVGVGPGNGEWHPSPTLPAGLPPVTVTLQAGLADPAGPTGYTVTNAVAITFP